MECSDSVYILTLNRLTVTLQRVSMLGPNIVPMWKAFDWINFERMTRWVPRHTRSLSFSCEWHPEVHDHIYESQQANGTPNGQAWERKQEQHYTHSQECLRMSLTNGKENTLLHESWKFQGAKPISHYEAILLWGNIFCTKTPCIYFNIVILQGSNSVHVQIKRFWKFKSQGRRKTY